MVTTEQKIKETEAKLRELKQVQIKENDKSKWIYVKELNIEIQTKIHDKDKSYDELIEIYGKEFLKENLPTYAQLQFLRNSKDCKKFGLEETWEFVKQEDKISRKNGYVARFIAGSGYAYLGCNGSSSDSNSGLGVRFVRKKENKK